MKYQIIIDDEVKEQAARAVAEGRILNLKNDIVFKSFFSKKCKESAYCRRKMLSAVIGQEVEETKVLNPELLPTRTDGKFPRLDIHCKLADGSEVDVELQNSMYKDDQIKRSIYYAATLTHNALSSGEPYSQLPHIYQIMFMDFQKIEDKKLHHAYTFKEREDNTELSDIMQIHYIELPKINEILKKLADGAKELSEVEFWSILIKMGGNPQTQSLLQKLTAMQEEMDMAQALLNKMSRNQQEWENQFGYERFVHDCISREKYAFNSGHAAGLAEGERKKALETARTALLMNIAPEQIAKLTGLSAEEIKRLS
ncbi:Rpn family recombination-promoting nuclease/putative transposase [uncultured Treponema sp.]|uniref:Rpn family recombination-promoting nuclease/putative transposase n=1 Tax=uncultured Treponema sp. TaxID=162155 RepID=UPI0025E56E1C|nr:Rpn family recombination-promoting nuclease/putative transposase [uncultured Treponema sp.]